ncbi:hypothetical protein, partial [Nitrolancea hollandica]|uniref:hypothetical protein n=1 Tax=Nitrolancea hollandica TaxID=1206749 RepID=UPI001EE64453
TSTVGPDDLHTRSHLVMDLLVRFLSGRGWCDFLSAWILTGTSFIRVAVDMYRASVGKGSLGNALTIPMLGQDHDQTTSLGDLFGIIFGQILRHIEPGHGANPATHGRSGRRAAEKRADPTGGDDRTNTRNCQRTQADQRADHSSTDASDCKAPLGAARGSRRFGFGWNDIGRTASLGNEGNLVNSESGIVECVNCLLSKAIITEHTDDGIEISTGSRGYEPLFFTIPACIGQGDPPCLANIPRFMVATRSEPSPVFSAMEGTLERCGHFA